MIATLYTLQHTGREKEKKKEREKEKINERYKKKLRLIKVIFESVSVRFELILKFS